MSSPDQEKTIPTAGQDIAADLAKYGITRIPVDYFYFGSYRYTNLEDAVAAAKRAQKPG